MSDGVVELLVVGAGISGLGMALMARRHGVQPLILEAGTHIGGAINSHRFNTDEGRFWAELGGHTCYNSYGNLLQLLEESGQLDKLKPKRKLRYWIQAGDRLTSIPSQLNYFELLGVLPRLWTSKKSGRTVAEYFGRIMGRRNFKQVLGPALDAVVCQPAADFPADALFRKKPRRKEIVRSYTGPEGLQSFIEGISAGLEIRLNSPVVGLEKGDGHYRVLTPNGTIHAKYVALAVAPDVAAKIVSGYMPALAARLQEIEMAAIVSHAVLLRTERVKLPLLAGIIGVADDFYSVVSRDLVADENYRAFTFHFRPDGLDEAGRLTRISEVLGVDQDQIDSHLSCSNRLPALRLGQAERIAWIDKALQAESLALTGNWFSGVSIEDSLIRSRQECHRLFGTAG
ncbi:MAG: protoporphyrinogen oxidase [gamma proteobacterium symbiont of Ctena orbiculata]|nr:MAG: protoporphyrinogen oxidase [gamma proteobacterium symbiont of Ctena orbiculata]PVV18580.1 MAG: protoporphyrinogen oxidase [gamma proteobacterium symbiont of Ctena orbiculata]PVV26071.1 MAG: protoporphyrinogen oxidase [gamma proteobacterium symbiont of Ctena orbiculata]